MKISITRLLIFLYYLKIVSFILIPFLIIGIVFLVKKLKIISKKIENLKNWFGVNPFLVSSSKSKRQWLEIENLLEEPYQSSWKLSVIKADALIENFLKQLGFSGKTFSELLESLKLKGYQNLQLLQGIHQVCEEILNNKEYNLSQKEAKNIVEIYKRFWNELIENVL